MTWGVEDWGDGARCAPVRWGEIPAYAGMTVMGDDGDEQGIGFRFRGRTLRSRLPLMRTGAPQ